MAYSAPASSFPRSDNEVESNRPSTSAGAYSSCNHDYDVFINHRGPDVKKTFASALYRRLTSEGRLSAFLDQQELQEGESITSQIQNAIRSASVHIAIFSPGYAESNWCLDELVLMRESGRTIIPVFYHVKPSALRWTQGENGLYAKAFHDLEAKKTYEGKLRYDTATIKKWRNALVDVAEISGFELEACNGDEGELLDKVVKGVLKKVGKTSFKVAKYPTGVDEKVKDFEETILLQQQQSGKPQIVGIVGFGGVGKTTLAKEFFNRKSSHYSKSCFLSNVKENKDDGSLIILQKKLFQSLTGSDLRTDNIDEAIKKLKTQAKFQAFVVLDDVDDVNQVDAVLAFETALSSDSLILITSRDRDVLRRSGVQNSSIYKLSRLNPQHSRELFCSHAFCRPHPLPGFESLVDKFLEACDGLPLSLKVFGSLLCGNNDKGFWEDHLDRLRQILPHEIGKILRISYDGLDRDEKEIFLDIANFFVGEKRDMAIRIWDGSGWKGSLAFQNLQNKSLVEVDSENEIKMHDHLRDMGREIVEVSEMPRRHWRCTENIDDLLHNEQLISEVRGIRTGLRTAPDHESWYKKSRHGLFGKLRSSLHNRKLQLLDVEDGHLVRILTRLHSPNLIWLRWRNCSSSSLPSWVPVDNLRVLQVFSSVLKKLWQGKSQAPLQLRELVINSPLSELPKSTGQLKHLELIILNCPSGNLKTLPDELCDLQSLKRFDLTNCSEVKSLPDSFGKLTNLEHIDLSGCKKLERLPDSFGHLRSLKRFKLTNCSEIKSLPESLRHFTVLEHIDLSRCENLVGLPDSFGHLLSLKRLELTGCKEIKSLPDSLRFLTNLEHIDLSHSENIQRLPDSFGDLIRLKYLDLSRCNNLTISSNTLGEISTLEYINLSYCTKVEVLPLQIACQRSLAKLYCPFLEMVPSLLGENLKELKLRNGSNRKQLRSLPISDGLLNQLTKLTVNECVFSEFLFENEGETETSGLRQSRRERTLSNLGSSIDMSKLLKLRHIELYKTEISEVSFEGFCPNLQHLLIKSCDHLVKVGTLPNALIKLELTRCSKLKKIEGLCGLAKLQILNIKWCKEVEELSNIETLVSLEVLDVNECRKLKRIHRFAQLTKLRRLEIVRCSELEELPGVEHVMSLKWLKWLDASECPKVQWAEGVLEQLRQKVPYFNI